MPHTSAQLTLLRRPVVLLAAMLVIACPGPQPAETAVATSANECRLPKDRLPAEIAPVADVPEYHDCQRLAAGQPVVYGPKVGIYVVSGLDSVFKSDSGRNQPAAHFVALIRNFGPDDYRGGKLVLPAGYSCLRLQPGVAGWSASLEFRGSAPTCETTPSGAVIPLQVTREQPPGDDLDEDYPPVARWEWDAQELHHFIGIKCGTGWCEVAGGSEPQGVRPPAAAPIPGVKRAGHPDRVKRVKGWFDQQQLAVATASSLQPGPVGTIYPHPDLANVDFHKFGSGWVDAGQVQLEGTQSYTSGKLRLEPGLTLIALCQDKAGNCAGAPRGRCAPSPGTSSESSATWYARLTSPRDSVYYACITKEQHPNVTIPATARWRWSASDETIWVRCTNGCCTVS